MANFYQNVHRLIETTFITAWENKTLIKFENRQWEKPSSPWAELNLGWGFSQPIAVNGQKLKCHDGNVYICVLGPRDEALKLAIQVKDIFSAREFRSDMVTIQFADGNIGAPEVRWNFYGINITYPFLAKEIPS